MTELPALTTARTFARALVTVLGWRLVPAAMLPLLLGLSEGAGILLLVPLLGQIGLEVGEGTPGRLAASVERGFGALGVPFTLVSVLATVAVVSCAHAALAQWQLRLHPRLDRLMLTHYRTRLYEAFVQVRWAYAVRGRVSDRVHALMSEVAHVSMLTYQVFSLVAGGMLLLVYLAVAFRLSAPLTALVLCLGAVLLMCQRSGTRRSTSAAAAYSAASAALHHVASESVAGLKTVRSYGAEERTITRVRALDARMAGAYLDIMSGYARTKLWFDLGSTVGLVLVLYVAVSVLQVSTVTLVVLILLFMRLLPRIASLQAGAQQFRAALPGFGRALAQLDAHEMQREPLQTQPAPSFARAIRVDGVSFRYAGEGPDVLADVNLALAAGKTTAIVGISGAGKSTIADLLMGLVTPTRGRIVVDDVVLAPAAGAAWRSHLAYVAQDPVLFNDTIRENLLWAEPGVTDAELRRALSDAAAEFVHGLPHGLDTEIGDRGARLSGGERQRLALARALLRRPSLLILDEATSSLDAEHEQRILQAVQRLQGRVTIVLITHRLTTVRHADLIHVLEDGRLIESGSWADLLARPRGRFRQLWATQLPAVDAPAAAVWS